MQAKAKAKAKFAKERDREQKTCPIISSILAWNGAHTWNGDCLNDDMGWDSSTKESMGQSI